MPYGGPRRTDRPPTVEVRGTVWSSACRTANQHGPRRRGRPNSRSPADDGAPPHARAPAGKPADHRRSSHRTTFVITAAPSRPLVLRNSSSRWIAARTTTRDSPRPRNHAGLEHRGQGQQVRSPPHYLSDNVSQRHRDVVTLTGRHPARQVPDPRPDRETVTIRRSNDGRPLAERETRTTIVGAASSFSQTSGHVRRGALSWLSHADAGIGTADLHRIQLDPANGQDGRLRFS